MIEMMLSVLTPVAALGCGLMAGVFFAFSAGVMPALARRPAAEGIAAMQAINVAVINPVFLGVFLGTAVVCALLVALAPFAWSQPGAAARLAGGLLYLVGALLVTIVANIPRNNALATVEPASPTGTSLWADFRRGWTRANHLRTAGALAAATVLTILG